MYAHCHDDILLTIVTVNLNNGENLRRTLESFRQIKAPKEVEFLFIDGKSTDSSIAIAKEYYLEQNIISEPDDGIYSAMNKGLYMAKGKYILWINSGDRLKDNVWSNIKGAITRSNAAVVVFGLEIYNEKGDVLIETRFCNFGMLPHKTLTHPSTVFLKEAIVAVGGYSERYRISADRRLFLSLYQGGYKFDFPKVVLSIFFLGGKSSDLRKSFYEDRKIDLEFGIITAFSYYWLLFLHELFLFYLMCRKRLTAKSN